jgi:hypothetical protein
MNRRNFGILVAVAVVLGVIAMNSVNRNGTQSIAGNSAGSLLLPALTEDLDSIVEISVTGAGSERLVTVTNDNGDWTVTELDGYAADRSTINALLIEISETRIVEEKTAEPAFHSRLGVEDIAEPEADGLELSMVAADGDRYAVVLGDVYTSNQRYARVAGQPLSVLVSTNPNIATDASEWVNAEIIALDNDRIQRVEIQHADGESLVIRKEARGDTNFLVDDIPEGRELQYAGVANVTGNLLQNLGLDQVRRGIARDSEAVSVSRFLTFDGLVIEVSSYADEDGQSWLSFVADFDAEQALAYATETVGEFSDDADSPENAAPDVEPETDAIAEAEEINARLGEWEYQIPSYQLSQMTRRMEDLLQPLADD